MMLKNLNTLQGKKRNSNYQLSQLRAAAECNKKQRQTNDAGTGFWDSGLGLRCLGFGFLSLCERNIIRRKRREKAEQKDKNINYY